MQILERWKGTQLLNAFSEDKQTNAAHCLAAQVALNEKLENPSFKRASVPIIVRAFSQSNAFKRNNFDMSDGLHEAKNVHVFSTKFSSYDRSGRTGEYNLEEEAKYVADLSNKIMLEFDELFRDQFNKYIVFHGFETTDSGQILLHYDL